MHQPHPQSMIRLALLALLASGALTPAAAEQHVVHVGDMKVRADAAHWHVNRSSPDEVLLSPSATIAGKHDAVRIVRRSGKTLQDCSAMAKTQWPGDIYADQRTQTSQLGGRPGVRLTLHTRCRNATPTGVMVCAIHRDSLYAVMTNNAITNCRSFDRVLFARASYFEELARAIAFEP